MTLLELDDTDLTGFARQPGVGGVAMPLSAPLRDLSIEATEVDLGLVALRGDEIVDEIQLMLVVRLRVDEVVHLWSEDTDPLAATVVLDPVSHRLRMSLRLEPAGRSAQAAMRVATFLQNAGRGTHLALRLPDGQLAPDRLPVPPELQIDDRLVRLLQLLDDVSRLAAVDVPVPEHVDEELLKDLLVARRLLSGEVVRGRWSTGQLRLGHADLDTLQAALNQATRHELLHIAVMRLEVGGTTVALGEVQQQFSDAVVEDLVTEGDEVVLRVRAHDGTGGMTMTPVAKQPAPVEPLLTLGPAAFDQLVADLEAPARRSPLRELL